MVWDPKDPWSKKGDDLDQAFKQAQKDRARDAATDGDDGTN